MFAEYFRAETRTLGERSLAEVRTLEDWNKTKVTARQQLFEMLGLDPLPPKTDLKATVTAILAPGTTALWKYRALYLDGDAVFGQWSDTATIAVQG